jgi:hypothetical protein
MIIWSELYAATLGGLFGGFWTHFAMKKINGEGMKILESYWNADLRSLRSRLEKLNEEINLLWKLERKKLNIDD